MALTIQFRDGFYVGGSLAVIAVAVLLWRWQPERQVNHHAVSLLHTIERRDWAGMAELIDAGYHDQWGDDRSILLERLRKVFRNTRGARFIVVDSAVKIQERNATWTAKIVLEGENDEFLEAVKERVNSLSVPFELEWRRASAKPWDWTLIRVSNPQLEIPSDAGRSLFPKCVPQLASGQFDFVGAVITN